MGAFREIDWSRIDCHAIVESNGIGVIDERRHAACRSWLLDCGYRVETLDFRGGLSGAVAELERLLRWQEQFGYSLARMPGLDALKDGFEFEIAEGEGLVLEVLGAEDAWTEDAWWFLGMISVAQRYSRMELATGGRFFLLLVVPEQSKLPGVPIEQASIPGPFWNPQKDVHEFRRRPT